MQVFIVNGQNGTKVITASKLANDLKNLDRTKTVKWRKCDLESMAADAVRENLGKALTEATYAQKLLFYADALDKYTELTPYGLLEMLTNECAAN